MRGSFSDVPVVFEVPGVTSRQLEWGDFSVALETLAAGTDTEPVFKGLPDDRCQCPHWGYVVSGAMRVRYADHEETIRGGDAYYLPAGHLPIFDEDTVVIEFSPRGEYQKTLEIAGRNIAKMLESSGQPA